MKKYFALVPLLLLSLVMTSCSSLKPGCLISDKLSSVATDVIVSKLECKSPFAVKADMDALVKGLGLCKTGQIADLVCPSLVDSVVDKVVAGVVPSTWQCSAVGAKDLVKDALTQACKAIPVSEWKPE